MGNNDQTQIVMKKVHCEMKTAWGKNDTKNGIWSEMSLFMQMELT